MMVDARLKVGAAALAALFVCASVLPAQAGPTAEQKCTATKSKASGKHGQCHATVIAKAISKAVAPDAAKQTKCDDKTTKAFDKAELKAAGACLTTGDLATVSTEIEQCSIDLSQAIRNGQDPTVAVPESKCDGKKTKAAGKYLSCLFNARSKAEIKGLTPDFTKCTDKLTKLINKSNAKGPCSVTGDLASIQSQADNCFLTTLFDGNIFEISTYTIDCVALGLVAVSLPIDVTAAVVGPITAGSSVDVELNSIVVIDEGTSQELVTLLNGFGLPTAATINSATLSTSASAGADAPNPQDLLVVGPLAIDLADDTSVPPNFIPGPHLLATDTLNTSYDVSLAASQLDIGLDVVAVDLTATVNIVLSTAGGGDCTLNGSPMVLPVQP